MSTKILRVLFIAVVLGAFASMGSADEGPAERAGRKVDQATVRAEDKLDSAGQKTKRAARKLKRKTGEVIEKTGEVIKQAGEDLKK